MADRSPREGGIPAPSYIGQRFGAYEIVALVGAGGMGEVYRAQDSRLGRDVAVKVLPPAFSADGARRQRFQREARAIGALNHPNICTIHDVGQANGVDFLVMELLKGETLAVRLARGPPVPIAEDLTNLHPVGWIARDESFAWIRQPIGRDDVLRTRSLEPRTEPVDLTIVRMTWALG